MRFVVALVAMLTAGCGLIPVEAQNDPGPEQFAFTILPGGDVDPAAVVADLVQDQVGIENAVHVGSVATPVGTYDIVTFEEDGPDGRLFCVARIGEQGASSSCSSEPEPPVDDDGLRASSAGSDGTWAEVEVRAGAKVKAIRFTADEGAVYRSNVVGGFGFIVYPLDRGSLLAQGLGADGQPVGLPVHIEMIR